ncbi:MAG: hypothetical protein EXR76_18860 [Myxococcales bacterium]|nr:hypothetical protein [Myxococcales bacterium]
MNSAFDSLVAATPEAGQTLEFTAEGLGNRNRSHIELETVRQEWRELASSPGSAAESGPRYDHLVADVRTMITHAGDTSNLILDPDLDSYYLMDVTLLALPQTQDRLARVVMMGSDLLGEPLTAESRVAFAVQAALLQEADLDRVMASAQTALNEDPNFYGASPTFAAGVKAREASFHLWNVSVDELDRLLNARVARSREESNSISPAMATV